jgi:uncharacterized membrane protein (DUF2068 family)
MRVSSGLRTIAVVEASKGALALLAAFGILAIIPQGARHVVVELVGRLHLNAGKSYPSVFLKLLEDTANAQLWLIAALVVVYAFLRFLEAYGLWRSRPWAQWLAAASGAIYVPFEIYELTRGVSWIKLGALLLNLAVVGYMCYALWRSRHGAGRPAHNSRGVDHV